MKPRRSEIGAAAFYPAVVIAGWAVVSLAGIGSPHIEASGAAHVVDRLAPALAANVGQATAPLTGGMAYAAAGNIDAATAAEFMTQPLTGPTSAPKEPQPIVVASLADPAEVLPAEVAQRRPLL